MPQSESAIYKNSFLRSQQRCVVTSKFNKFPASSVLSQGTGREGGVAAIFDSGLLISQEPKLNYN